ncbi:MAG: PIG-L deacetylase family protein [Candidatus Omnitrophota bacterium]
MKSRKTIFVILFILFSCGSLYPAAAPQTLPAVGPILSVTKTDRVLILAPHPDDEAIGCAGIIQEALGKGAQVKIAYLTNGDHNQAAFIVYEKRLTLRRGEFIYMGEIRREEAVKAMELLGVDRKNLIFLGYPDFGTLTIFRNFWGETKPYKSILTRISSVPYKDNLSFGAPYKGESILADLKRVLLEYKPNKIFVSHPADANVDHKALYLFLQIALRDLERELPRPEIYPYLIHCIGWPLPRHYHPQLGLDPPKQFLGSQAQWIKFELTPEQLDKKHRAIMCYRSQTSSSAFYLLAFARKNELFGDYPEIVLSGNDKTDAGPVQFLGASNMINVSKDVDWNTSGDIAKGKGRVSYALLNDSLLIRIDKPRELNKRLRLQLYLFGYSREVPFASMPKIRIVTLHKKFGVLDGRKMIKADGLSLKLDPDNLMLRVPLRLLSRPDFILAAVKTYSGIMHTDTTSFRKIDIK